MAVISISLVLLVVSPVIICVPTARATGSCLGSTTPLDVILASNSTILIFSGHGCEEDVELIHTLAEGGKKIMHIQHWWSDLINNPLLIYYNDTFKIWARESLNFSLYGTPTSFEPEIAAASLNPEDIWGVTLGDEEPAWIRYTTLDPQISPDILRYNDTYLAETGYVMKPTSQMNGTENHVFVEWMNEKSVWVYNYLYDHVRKQVPHAVIFQYMIMPPTWGLGDEYCAAYELKADGFSMDCYYAVDQPWLLYETNRRYRVGMPDTYYMMTIWGTIWDFVNDAGDGIHYKEGSYEQIRRETWISYLSSVDALGYFNWAPQYNDSYNWAMGSERTDIMGQRLWRYIDNLAGQLAYLPTFNPEPEVLVVGSGYQTGDAMLNVANLGLFSEYDLVSMREFSFQDIDLSNYSLILVTDGWNYNETILKLNEYVDYGGNLMFLGGIRTEEAPINTGDLFAIEQNVTELWLSEHALVNFTQPNMLGIDFTSEYNEFYGWCIDDENLSSDYHPVGEFSRYDGVNLEPIEDYPLVLYHNESKPESGWTLWFGINTARNGTLENPDRKLDLWNLYQVITRGFATFLNMTNSISSETTENMLITAAQIDSATVMGGIINFENNPRIINFTYDLSQLGFPDGEYFIHSLDSDMLLGQFQTNNQVLSFECDVERNGTRLFLISETHLYPDYSIDIFPLIPRASDFNDTPSSTTTTTEKESSTTSGISTDTITQPDSPLLYSVGGGLAIIVTLVLFAVIRKRNQSVTQ